MRPQPRLKSSYQSQHCGFADQRAEQVLLATRVKDWHINRDDVRAFLLGDNAPLLVEVGILAPQTVDGYVSLFP